MPTTEIDGIKYNDKWWVDNDSDDYLDIKRYLVDTAPVPGDFIAQRITFLKVNGKLYAPYIVTTLGYFDGFQDLINEYIVTSAISMEQAQELLLWDSKEERKQINVCNN